MSILDTLLGRGQPPTIGVDVSASAIRLVELSQDKTGQITLERYASEALDKGWIVDGTIENLEEVANALRKALSRSGTKAKHVVLALPQHATITKRVTMPGGLREEDMESQVEQEAGQYIPFSLDEVSLDFCVIGPAATEGDVDVLVAAARKDRIDDRQALAESVGLTPVVLDISSYAARLAVQRIIKTLPQGGEGALVALFQIGSESTGMSILRDDELLFEREQAFGGAQLTQSIARQYGFSFEEAEKKKLSGELPEDYAEGLLGPFVDTMSQEIGRALQFFFTSTPHHKVDYVMLAGGAVALPGLQERVTELTGFPAVLANPFEGMKLAPSVREAKLQQEAAGYLTACGLAMRRFLS